MNRLVAICEAGQAVWLDYIRRDILENGELKTLIERDGISGVTSNPAIFAKAIGGSDLYDDEIRRLLTADPESTTEALYERLAIGDIRRAADLLMPVYDTTNGADGFVSLEVSPHLARDSEGTIAEARRFWKAVDRPNLMIKVPATEEGTVAIEELIAEGIHVNVTLIFSLAQYEAVAQAYIRGAARSSQPKSAASVASFFVSRVDSAVDKLLEAAGSSDALGLRGRIAIANSKLAYRRFQELFHGAPFADLRAAGVRPQRVLWASTSTKNPAYRDVLYVEELIGPETVNTVPPQTLDAFREHGEVAQTLLAGLPDAEAAIVALERSGIDLGAVTEQLQLEGLEKFVTPFDGLLATLDEKRRAVAATAAQ